MCHLTSIMRRHEEGQEAEGSLLNPVLNADACPPSLQNVHFQSSKYFSYKCYQHPPIQTSSKSIKNKGHGIKEERKLKERDYLPLLCSVNPERS